MFNPDKDMTRIIFEILGREGKSISSLSRELEVRGFKFHRLILTGYLRALADIHLLRERDVPPAKIYVPYKSLQRDIYEAMAFHVREIEADEERAERLIKYGLYRLFRRPLFESELRRADTRPAIDDIEAAEEDVSETRKYLSRRGFKIPKSMRAFVYDDEGLEEDYVKVLEELMLDGHDATHLVRDTRQTRLL